MRDVAHVRDGFASQTNMVRQDGRRSVLLTVIKKGGASTLAIVKQLKELLPTIRAAAPPGLEVKELFDQSLFVRAAITGVLTEGAIAAFLTGADDPALPRELAQHPGRRSCRSRSRSSRRHGDPERHRPDPQRDDPRRARAGGRHPRRRRHRGDREHPPQPRPRQAVSCRRFSTARSRSPCRRSCRRCGSASSSCRWSSSPARRSISSRRWPWPSCSRCWRRICCRARSSRRWYATCSASEAHGDLDSGATRGFFARIHDGFQRGSSSFALAYVRAARGAALARRGRVLGVFAVRHR